MLISSVIISKSFLNKIHYIPEEFDLYFALLQVSYVLTRISYKFLNRERNVVRVYAALARYTIGIIKPIAVALMNCSKQSTCL